MNFNNFTIKAQEAVQEAVNLVQQLGQQTIEPAHLMAGVLKADEGEILIDGQQIYDNPEAKAEICFIPDTAFFPVNATPASMAAYYATIYPQFQASAMQSFSQSFRSIRPGSWRPSRRA